MVVAEQNVWWVAPLASPAYLRKSGVITAQGSADEVMERQSLITSYLGDEIADSDPEPNPG